MAEPLLLLHGFTATRDAWGPVAGALAASFDLHGLTLAGHTGGPPLPPGDSIPALVDDIERRMDAAGLETAHLAGFSLGGWLSLELAKRGRARTVTAIAPGGSADERGWESRRIKASFRAQHLGARLALPQLHAMVRRPRWRRLAFREQMVRGELVPPPDAERMIRAFVATPVFERFVAEIGTAPGLTDLERVDVPVHVVWGERDRILPRNRHEPFFREHLRGATFEVLPRAGHVPFWEATAAIVEAIERTASRAAAPSTV